MYFMFKALLKKNTIHHVHPKKADRADLWKIDDNHKFIFKMFSLSL